jgi:hypothetical protein
MSRHTLIVLTLVALAACGGKERTPETAQTSTAKAVDPRCFGGRVLSFKDLVAEVVIPAEETCASGTFQVVFTRGTDTLTTLTETRVGTVGFIGTADVDGDGRGEFFVSTIEEGDAAKGALFAYTDTEAGMGRMILADLDSAQRMGYTGHDRFGFGGADQLVRAFPRTGGDTAWFAYSHGEKKWNSVARPSWIR